MKQIILANNQQNLGFVENVNYIRKQENGSYGLCSQDKAEGIAYNGNTYKLFNRGENVEGDVVLVVDIDLGEIIKNINVVNSIAFVTLAEENKIDEVTSEEHKELFNDFEVGVLYKVGNIRKYKDNLYKCISEHTSQADWTPDISPTLWKQISDPATQYPLWSQPVGAFDCYMKGDRVLYNDKKYVTIVDNNVWQPDVYGWEVIVNE